MSEKRKSIVFYDKDKEVLEHLSKQSNISDYIKNLVKEDIIRKESEQKFIKENIKKEIDSYMNTKGFKRFLMATINEYMEVYDRLNKKKK